MTNFENGIITDGRYSGSVDNFAKCISFGNWCSNLLTKVSHSRWDSVCAEDVKKEVLKLIANMRVKIYEISGSSATYGGEILFDDQIYNVIVRFSSENVDVGEWEYIKHIFLEAEYFSVHVSYVSKSVLPPKKKTLEEVGQECENLRKENLELRKTNESLRQKLDAIQ